MKFLAKLLILIPSAPCADFRDKNVFSVKWIFMTCANKEFTKIISEEINLYNKETSLSARNLVIVASLVLKRYCLLKLSF